MVDTTLDGARQQFQEQIDFFRAKLNVPTERWDDIKLAAHDRAFMVAGAQKANLLNDLHAAVDKAITGESIGTFRKDFAAAVRKSGWSGWAGEGSKAGEAWRTRVIYTTNVSTSYAAGRWQQLNDPELLQVRPFWEYIHADGVMHPRPLHVSWNGLTLRNDHPFWATHFCPNGWGCHCRVRAVRKPAAGAKTQPPAGWDAIDAKTGAPVGIDKGWDYAPGASLAQQTRAWAEAKAATLPPVLARALMDDIAKVMPKPVFVEAATVKAAAEWAVKNNLADYADYAGVKTEVANAWNRSLFDHLQEFPALRANQKFVGTCQAQMARWRDLEVERFAQLLRDANPNPPPGFDARSRAEKYVQPRKMNGKVYAHSVSGGTVQGVAVNKKFGADLDTFNNLLKHDVAVQWHPVGADTVRSVVDHELGHQLDDLLDLKIDSAVVEAYKVAKLKGVKNEVSQYADKNIQEFIAECWAEACNNPQPREFATSIAKIIRERYASKYPGVRA